MLSLNHFLSVYCYNILNPCYLIFTFHQFIATISWIDVISYSFFISLLLQYLELMLSLIHFSSVYCYTISNRCYLLFTFNQFIATLFWINVISYSLFISLLLQYLELMLSLIHFSSVYCYNILNWCYLLFTFHQFIATLSRIDATYYSFLISLLLQYLESMLSRIQFSSVYCYTILNQCYLVFNFHQFIATISRINVISYSLYISLLLQYLESMSSRIHFFISLLLQCLESMLSRIQFSSVYCYTILNQCYLVFNFHQFIATISWINVISYSIFISLLLQYLKSMLYLTHFTSVYCYNISNQCYLLFINVVICLLLHYLELILSLIHFSSVYCYNISNIHAISYSLSSVYGTISWIDIISYSLFISLLLHYHESKKTDKNMYYNGTLLIPTKIAVSWEEELMFIVGWLMLFSLEKSKFLESSTVCYDSHIIHVINFFFFSLKYPWSFISSLWYCTKYNQLIMMQMQ